MSTALKLKVASIYEGIYSEFPTKDNNQAGGFNCIFALNPSTGAWEEKFFSTRWLENWANITNTLPSYTGTVLTIYAPPSSKQQYRVQNLYSGPTIMGSGNQFVCPANTKAVKFEFTPQADSNLYLWNQIMIRGKLRINGELVEKTFMLYIFPDDYRNATSIDIPSSEILILIKLLDDSGDNSSPLRGYEIVRDGDYDNSEMAGDTTFKITECKTDYVRRVSVTFVPIEVASKGTIVFIGYYCSIPGAGLEYKRIRFVLPADVLCDDGSIIYQSGTNAHTQSLKMAYIHCVKT